METDGDVVYCIMLLGTIPRLAFGGMDVNGEGSSNVDGLGLGGF